MKHYIYKLELSENYLHDSSRDERFSKIVGEHFNYLKDLLDKEILLMAGRTLNEAGKEVDWKKVFGVAVFKAENDEDAADIMRNDPAVLNGIMTATLHEFSLALMKTPQH